MYLTAYKRLKKTFYSVEKFKADKVTMCIESEDYNPSDNIKQAISDFEEDVLGLPEKFQYILDNKSKHYHTFQIPKRSGGMRDIKEPVGDLKEIQRRICYTMKSQLKVLPHNCCHGFVKYRRCLSAMQVHQANESMWFLKVDLKNFFPSISSGLIYEMFKKIPQTAQLSVEARRILVDFLTDETGHLTQGCISSPYIANLVLIEFDYLFSQYCRENNLIYTRYADDMCISSRVKFNVGPVVNEIKSLLPAGIKLNPEKTKMTSFNQQNVFLGIHYNQNKDLTVGRGTKHLMKVIAHKMELGQIPAEETQTWKGRLSYYSSIEPEYFSNPKFDVIRRA